MPDKQEIYPRGFSTYVEPPVCSAAGGRRSSRTFRGVTTIVQKLFGIIPADVAYFGQKDFQQALVIQTMVAELNTPIRIEVCPDRPRTGRPRDEFANRYLAPDERQRLSRCLKDCGPSEAAVNAGERDAAKLVAEMKAGLNRGGNSAHRLRHDRGSPDAQRVAAS